MSSLIVEITPIEAILPHPNADRLEIAKVRDWNTIVQKGAHSAGERVIYVPIDSVLSPELESYLFPPDSKIKLDHGRVRSIKIRQAVSQGMVVALTPELLKLYPKLVKKSVGDDVAEILGVTKWEPPAVSVPSVMHGHQRKKTHKNPLFVEYFDVPNIKFYPDVFAPDEEVYLSEKLHGSSARYGILPVTVNTTWKRIKKWLHLLPAQEFVFGSRHVELTNKPGHKTFYDENIYEIIANRLHLASILESDMILFGEITGYGIQKGYTYGATKPGEYQFWAYDIMSNGRYWDYLEFKTWCDTHGVQRVPELYVGPYKDVDLKAFSTGPSTILDDEGKTTQEIREGLVVKPTHERATWNLSRVELKVLNDDYLLLKDGTDFH